MRVSLRLKFFVFASLLAIVPLSLVGENLVRITRDELKSAANEDLTSVAAQVRTEFDSTFQGRWLSPLMVIRNGIDSDTLDVPQKISLLTLGLEELPGVVALQLTVHGSDLPILATEQTFAERLAAAGLDPVEILATSAEQVAEIDATGQYGRPIVSRLPETGDWIATLALPLTTTIAGRQVTLAAKIELGSLSRLVERHPFTRRGEITVVDKAGRTVLGSEVQSLTGRDIVADALPLIVAGARADALGGYTREDGTAMLAAYAFPDWFEWAVITELSEASAYAVVNQMTQRVLLVGLVGFLAAGLGAIVFARRLTGPILKIGQVAERVGEGDFAARVEGVRSRDEIGDLAGRFNAMIAHLAERLELMKFVSRGTVSAIQQAEEAGVARGGTRRRVAVVFTDIRGYTEFSEAVPPEVVIEMLNKYLDVQTDLVQARGGDVDKFIGDALVAVFEGEDRERRAVAASLDIKDAMARLLDEHPEWNLHVGIGIGSGEVVMGAMGARERMDFTVLGSTVNLAARLCSKAAPGQVLVDRASFKASCDMPGVRFESLEPIPLKGYAEPVAAFAAYRPAARMDRRESAA